MQSTDIFSYVIYMHLITCNITKFLKSPCSYVIEIETCKVYGNKDTKITVFVIAHKLAHNQQEKYWDTCFKNQQSY